MVFVPEQAFIDYLAVGKPAFLLFVFFCKHVAPETNRAKTTLHAGAAWLGIDYQNACRLNAVLKAKEWIEQSRGEFILLKGADEFLNLKTDKNVSFQEPETDENVSISEREKAETDENISIENQKLIKTSVSGSAKTDKNVSFQVLKTDENISSDEKLTKTSVFSPTPPIRNILNYKNTRESCSLSANSNSLPKLDSKPERIPERFPITAEMYEWAKKHPKVSQIEDLIDATESWHLHWQSATGDKALSSDWIAVWKKGMKDHYEYEQRQRTKQNADDRNGSGKSGNGHQADDARRGSRQKTNGDNSAASRYGANPKIIT